MQTTIHHQNPSDVSQLIAEQHRALAKQLKELSRVARTVSRGGAPARQHAVELTSLLCDDLLTHIAIEGSVLVPALRSVDAWGDSRAHTLLGCLSVRRHEIEVLLTRCSSGDSSSLGAAIRQFVESRRSAMAWAEVHVLGTLRDDVICIDAEGG